MQTTLATTALLMGLAGGPHCIAMCGAACAGIGQAAGAAKTSAMWTFQLGRMVGYAGLGAVAAASMQGLGWLTVQSAALRPVWSMFHVAMLMLGLVLMIKAQQPVWMEQAGRKIWSGAKSLAMGRGRGAPMVIGVLWTFLPCGLLYSALLVAGLTGHPVDGALVMALFALGTSVSMMLGPWLWLRLKGNGSGDWGVRLAGLALAVSSVWALYMAYAHDTAPWCATS
ncbi:sulfite exporter TauE/SafE family protein [Rhodoferax sp.]|uniref:sulfite exporter TauE/SafE family protein n=1 Tax=Rhodoferax sp. TaxID=50421 RepID=UPI00262823A9|nr:sulfite exporter TauE/SafE family protein [Rhodoferax sp.]MDD2808905.1 sulfite exporter TauE/SafE family protein [Rhodoferax sp.]MDD4943497.1 sulfite exporter TauE/SafE family protein [Rhodoferax sp.]